MQSADALCVRLRELDGEQAARVGASEERVAYEYACAVSFQKRVEAERVRRAEEEEAKSAAVEREEARRRSAVVDAAPGCLDALREAVDALRADGERSGEALRAHRRGWERSPAGVTGLGGLSRAALARTRFLRRSVEKGIEFGGWWVRDVAFEFTISREHKRGG